MKIISLEVRSYAKGQLVVMFNDEDHMNIKLTDEENDRILQIGYEIFASRQKAIAEKIATAQPVELLELQSAYDETPF